MARPTPTEPQPSFRQRVNSVVGGFYESLNNTFKNFTLTAESGLEQLKTEPIGGGTAKGRINYEKERISDIYFACIPGAGQMYYGYMKRGLSMITFFCLFIMAGTLVDVLGRWLQSSCGCTAFFDTYDLIRHLAAGEPKDDDLLLPANWDNIRAILPQHNKLLGWGLIAFGVWALYDIPHRGLDDHRAGAFLRLRLCV